MKKEFLREKQFYLDTLYQDILPFWETYAPDAEQGGFFTCFTGNGGELVSTDKYIWSEGRMLWVLSRLCRRQDISEQRRASLHSHADHTARFLQEHCLLENGNVTFLTLRDGTHKSIDGIYDTSIYADCFVIIGMAAYAELTGSRQALAFAERVYDNAIGRYETGQYRTDPYPVPRGYRTHGLPMIFTNTSRELADAMQALQHPRAQEVSGRAYAFAKDVLDHFVDENHILREMLPLSGGFDDKTLLGRYFNPGHTIEDCWFMQMEWQRFGDTARAEKTARVLEKTLALGWDKTYGGIRLFVDMDGGAPHGEITDPTEPMVKKVCEDNMGKLWWPHSEALYSTLLFSDREEIAAWYPIIRKYTFDTFPNRENDRGEWIQIRDRQGRPENRLVALPVKDPFHIARNFILILELIEAAACF